MIQKPEGNHSNYLAIDQSNKISSESAVINYINSVIIDGEIEHETNCQRRVRIISEVAALTLLAVTKLPFINVSRTFAGHANLIQNSWGWLLAFCNISSFGVLDAYSINEILHDIIRPLSSEERLILTADSYRKIDLILRITAVFIAFVAVIPHTYVGYEYNNQSIVMGALAAVGCMFVPACSIYYSLNEAKKNSCLTPLEVTIKKSKLKVISAIEEFRSHLPKMPENALHKIILEFKEIQKIDQPLEKSEKLIHQIFSLKHFDKQPSKKRIYGDYFFKLLGSIFAFSVMAYLAKIGFVFGEGLTDSLAVGALTGLAVATCSCYLTFFLLVNATSSYYHLAIDQYEKKEPDTWSKVTYPKVTLALKFLAIIINSFAFAPTVEVVEDYFKGIPKDYLEVVAPLSFFIICSYLSLFLIDEIIEKYAHKHGTQQQRDILEISYRLKKFSNLLRKSPLIEFAKMEQIMPADTIALWQDKIKTTSEQLNLILNEEELAIN